MQGAHGQVEAAVPSVIAPGNYDGVHLGHRALVQSARAYARQHGLATRALTFDPHPLTLLDPARAPATLTLQPRRAQLLCSMGADSVIVRRFDRELAGLSPHAFVESLLEQGARALVVGPDFRFGCKRAGDVDLLQKLGQQHGFATLIEAPVLLDGERVSSSAVRRALCDGDVLAAARMLGRFHELRAQVVHAGQAPLPTATLKAEPVLQPLAGVYAVLVRVLNDAGNAGEQTEVLLPAIASLAGDELIQAQLLDCEAELHGKTLRIGFVARVRDTQATSGASSPRGQIESDCARARELLADRNKEWSSWI